MKHRNVSLFIPHLGCPNNCIFCNQKTISGKASPVCDRDIISACETACACPGDPDESEIAFFGGSFTAIDRELMIHCLELVRPYIGSYFSGIRISTRPDCITPEILDILKKYNVKSIELGAQSMDERVLVLNERGHTPADTFTASALIKEYGFSLGLQMMTGLYGSDEKTDEYTADCFCRIRPDTVRIYPTVVLEGTALSVLYRQGLYTPPGLSESVSLCARFYSKFTSENIRVIRMGLHSGGNVDEGFVAGVYHPAFGELCMSRIYRDIFERLLEGKPAGAYEIAIPEGGTSKACGQKKANRDYFAAKGYSLSFVEDKTLERFNAILIK